MRTDQQTRVEQWERRSEVPLLLLAGAFLVSYAWPVLDPSLTPNWAGALNWISWATYVAFAVDLAIRIVLADRRRSYLLAHWYDVLLIALPMLRPLRLLRLLAFARLLNRSAVGNLAGRVSVYVSGTAMMSVALGALAVLDAERGHPEANITSAGDALWWAATTVTTVGYGDRFPVTTTGRAIAVALMLVGISVVSSLTAVVATWMLKHVESGPDSEPAPQP